MLPGLYGFETHHNIISGARSHADRTISGEELRGESATSTTHESCTSLIAANKRDCLCLTPASTQGHTAKVECVGVCWGGGSVRAHSRPGETCHWQPGQSLGGCLYHSPQHARGDLVCLYCGASTAIPRRASRMKCDIM